MTKESRKQNVHYIADEALGGIEREYVEVERRASVGDYVINNKGNEYEEIYKVTGYKDEHTPSYTVEFDNFSLDEYVSAVSIDRSITLSPTNIVRVADVRYELQDRVAEEGELVLDVSCGVVTEVTSTGVQSVDVEYYEDEDGDQVVGIFHGSYRVLKPIEPKIVRTYTSTGPGTTRRTTATTTSTGPENVSEIIANLVRRVAELEKQAYNFRYNEDVLNERIGDAEAKLAELTETSEMLTDDVVLLDARTQPEEIVRVLAEDMAKRAVER